MQMITALFRVITQRGVVIPIFKDQEGFLTVKDGTDRLSRNVGKESPLYGA